MLPGSQHRCRNRRHRPCRERTCWKVWSKAVHAARLQEKEPKWAFW